MNRDLATRLHPEALLRALGLEPDPWQVDLLHARASQLLLLCSRQAGKSTVAAALALHEALYRANSLVLMLAPALRQSQELFRKLLAFYRALEQPVPAAAETALRLELQNGSRIESLPGREDTIRGYPGVRLLVIDEAARVPDALYHAVRPMLAVSSGRLLALSTPWGRRGWFYEAWTSEAEAWHRIQVTAAECPRISPAFLAAERLSMSPSWFAREYDCRLMETDDQVFAAEYIQAAFTPDLKPLWDGNL
jgi:hypothetical protein